MKLVFREFVSISISRLRQSRFSSRGRFFPQSLLFCFFLRRIIFWNHLAFFGLCSFMQRLSKWPPAAAAAVASFFPSKAMFDRIKPANKVIRLGPSKFNSTATVMTTPPLLKKKKSREISSNEMCSNKELFGLSQFEHISVFSGSLLAPRNKEVVGKTTSATILHIFSPSQPFRANVSSANCCSIFKLDFSLSLSLSLSLLLYHSLKASSIP